MNYLSVTALTKYIKAKLETDSHLTSIALKGEVSNFKLHSRGHLYFSIKDDHAQINAIMFAGDARRLKMMPKDGDQVLVLGKISVYEPSGSYSIQVMQLELDGIGILYQKYEALKKELEALGYFDASHKKPIPTFPKRIGVITSPTGAVIQDISNTINRRYQLVEILLYPAQVQGKECATTVSNQIRRANEEKLVDVLIVGRGGGSIEDLWGFNERIVAEAIYASDIPIISAVGHETDTTIADFVSDMRAPTPTAAAEIATPSSEQLKAYLIESAHTLKKYVKDIFQQKQLKLTYLEERLALTSPQEQLHQFKTQIAQYQDRMTQTLTYLLNMKKQWYVSTHQRLDPSISNYIKDIRYRFETQVQKLDGLSPLKVMDKGYGLLEKDQKIITSIHDVNIDDTITVTLKDGMLHTQIKDKKER